MTTYAPAAIQPRSAVLPDHARAAAAFWSQVNYDGPLVRNAVSLGRCWAWTGARDAEGYGYFGSHDRAHRLSLAMALGRPLRKGAIVMHRCDNPPCVRPSHLREASQAENVADMMAKGRWTPRAGEMNAAARLTSADVVAIRAAAASGTTDRELGRRFGVHPTTIGSVVRGASYAHVGGPVRPSRRAALTPDLVRAISESTERPLVLALRLGVSTRTIRRFRARSEGRAA